MNQFKFQPLTDESQLDENSILIVFGDTQILDSDRIPGGLEGFLNKGGAVLVATDRPNQGQLRRIFNVEFAKTFVNAPSNSDLAYKGKEECPLIDPLPSEDVLIFRGLSTVATNRPVYFINRSKELKTLAVFSDNCWVDSVVFGRHTGRVSIKDLKKVPLFQAASFAAAGDHRHGRSLILSDHSVFINAMMIPTDNDNFDFAYRCMDWLSDGGKRTHVLFLNEGEPITNLDVPVIDMPPPPIEVINQLLVKMEQENLFNRMILGEHPDERFRDILRVLIVALTTALTGFGCYRFLLARHLVETKEPLFSAKVAQQTPDMALTTQRHLVMIKTDNFWEAAHHLARDWFLANMPDSLPASAKSSAGRRVIERFSVDAGWRRRRSWEKKLRVVWHMAAGPPIKLSASEFARFVTQLDEIKAALAKGTLRLKSSAD